MRAAAGRRAAPTQGLSCPRGCLSSTSGVSQEQRLLEISWGGAACRCLLVGFSRGQQSGRPVWLTMGDMQSTCMFLLLGVPSHPVLSGAEHEETARRKRGAGGPEGGGQAAEGGGEQVREAEVGLLRSGPGEARGGLT